MTKYKYTAEEYRTAAKAAVSLAGMARELGLIPAGGNYETIKRGIHKFEIDTSHFLGGASSNMGNYSDTPRTKSAIKKKLIRERGHRCEKCSNTNWLNSLITLELEHIDGNSNNDIEDNLLLLCPNCHAQTPTWRRGKASFFPNPRLICPDCKGPKSIQGKYCRLCSWEHRVGGAGPARNTYPQDHAKRKRQPLQKVKTCECGNQILARSPRCLGCAHNLQTRIDWPSIDSLLTQIQNSNYLQVGKALGISDNAVREHLRNQGYDPKTLSPFQK